MGSQGISLSRCRMIMCERAQQSWSMHSHFDFTGIWHLSALLYVQQGDVLPKPTSL